MENQDKIKSTKASREINIPYQILLNFLIPIGVYATLLIFVFILGFLIK
jgi:hypothetical protein